MQNTELTDIEASLQKLVRRAYDIGRNDALKKVVDVLKADRSCSDQLALEAPTATSQPEHLEPEQVQPEHAEINGTVPAREAKPWWAWPVR